MSKATLDEMEALHGAVANHMRENLDDPRVLTQAVSFLKNNGVSVDMIESSDMSSISNTIMRIAAETKETAVSTDDMVYLTQ